MHAVDLYYVLSAQFRPGAFACHMKIRPNPSLRTLGEIVGGLYPEILECARHAAPYPPYHTNRRELQRFLPLLFVADKAAFVVSRIFFCESARQFRESFRGCDSETDRHTRTFPDLPAKLLSPFLQIGMLHSPQIQKRLVDRILHNLRHRLAQNSHHTSRHVAIQSVI